MFGMALILIREHHVLNERSVTVLVILPITDDIYQWRIVSFQKDSQSLMRER